MRKALDVAQDTTGRAHDLQALGYWAVGLYLRADRASRAMVEGLHSVGMKVFSVYERGYPTRPSYFTARQGSQDGKRAVAFARSIGQPTGSHIFSAVDYDAKPENVLAYQKAFRAEVKAAGYLASVYGSGAVCHYLISQGYANKGWLSCSTGWSGYASFKPQAAIIQHVPITVLGMDVDPDDIVDEGVCW